MAAVYLDGGFQEAFNFVHNQFSALFLSAEAIKQTYDAKSRLQELVQTSKGPLPEYRVVQETGPDHDKTFLVQLTLGPLATSGTGRSKKFAEQEAALKALERLQEQSSSDAEL